jgi:hypothetical protein
MFLPNRCLLLVAALVAPAALSAQSTADSGTFVIRRSGDTVATERFSRTATTLEGTLAIHNAHGTSQAYRAVIAPDATLLLIEVTVREDADSGRKGRLVQQARVIFREDSAAVDDISGRGIQTRVLGTQRGAIPYLNLSFALLEQAVRRSRAGPALTKEVPLFNLGGGQTVDGKVATMGNDSLRLAIGTVEFHLRVAPDGRVLGGSIPAQNVVVDRLGGS